MKCPYCHSTNTKVVESRSTGELETNRRRRECLDCNRRFTTFERVESVDLIVVKRDGTNEPFDRGKIIRGILRASEKRTIDSTKIEEITDEIENSLLGRNIDEVQSSEIGAMVMNRLKELDKVTYIRFASVHLSFGDFKEFSEELEKLTVTDVDEDTRDSTDVLLQVSTATKGTVSGWDRSRIVDALRQETKLDRKESEKIAISVERKIVSSGIKRISINQIRLLVDTELLTRGYNTQLKRTELLGMSTYNLNQLIFSKSNENSNIVFNNPEAVNLAIAENTLKQYALKEIFSKDVSDAHLNAVIHLHDLGYPIRAYCSAHSLEYIKKYGLSLVNLSTESSPAKHAQTLTGHLNTFLASMQAYYAGALGIGFVNIFYAPYFVGADDEKLKQEAQYLIFSCSQNAFSRGGQTIFMDFNIHLGIPNYLKNVPAIGSGGKYTGKTYGDYEREAQRFGKALMDVWRAGDKNGLPFPFPKMDLHVNQDSFDDPNQRELLRYACKIAAENGSPYFVFDRDEINLSMCCRLRTKITDMSVIEHPERLRFCGFQIVTVNLPQAAYRAKGNIDKTIREVEKAMDLCMKAHLQKKKFSTKIMERPGTPLWQVGKVSKDGSPYIDLEKATYLIGMVGLNECVKRITGQAIHESDDAYKVSLKIISSMYLKAKQLEKEHNLKVTLEETPAESTSFRFAKVDLQRFDEAKDFVRGDQKSGEIYYTNSVHLEADAPVDIVERIEKQARFNSLIESGAITHVFLGEQRPDSESIYQLVKKTWDNTQSAQIVISPEFTVCEDCGKITPGFMRDNTTMDL